MDVNAIGQAARTTLMHSFQAMQNASQDKQVPFSIIADIHGNAVTEWAVRVMQAEAHALEYLGHLKNLKEGKVKLADLTITDDGVMVKKGRPSKAASNGHSDEDIEGWPEPQPKAKSRAKKAK